jgi:hypothetical protein
MLRCHLSLQVQLVFGRCEAEVPDTRLYLLRPAKSAILSSLREGKPDPRERIGATS